MKKKLISVCILSMFLLVGCKSDAAYNEAIELGNEALKNKKYEDAITEFEKALEEKKDDKVATDLYNQSEKYVKALKSLEEREFDQSLELLDEVINYENGSDILIQEAKTLKEQVKKDKELNEKIDKLTKSSQDYFSNKNYSKAIKDIDKALELIKDNKSYDSQKETLTNIKEDCEDAIAKMVKEEEKRIQEVVKKKEKSLNSAGISEDKAKKILANYFRKEIGHAPNTIEVYEVIGNRYHMTADNYDDNGMRETYGWWYVDKSTGEVSR
ncbi:hypothetical protein [Terrisporobacter mayombei]|uniref:Tetratricopeptide repeat protein n=1 Tax=Terrisporobacter mayombei TaxID=1541 RepID=A0ABY9Q1U5_9FIRM|nr:hypothetical protein [Terrisporobacter mayombei]MCC3866788.1 hypothetical protein [Terrisporobacter mayombei]WMT81025.1 hypothetical protein TEMA_13570 [Terrisporobacter mayombei]